MIRKEQISLTGDLCSGKSTTCKILCEKLAMTYTSIGAIFRKEAESKGITVAELNKRYEGTLNDLHLDKKLLELRDIDGLVIDARLGWFFLPESFKVYLKTDYREITRRALKSDRGGVESYANSEEALNLLKERKSSEIKRYNEVYSINLLDEDNYDIVIDTTNRSPEEVVEVLLKGYYSYLSNKVKLFDFHNLIPTQSVRECNQKYIESIDLNNIEPITIVKKNNFYWIKDGHHRAIKLFKEGKRIPCIIENSEILDMKVSNMYDWEDAFKFRYVFNPF